MKKLAAASEWLRLRKKSVVAHWLFGGLCAGLSAAFFPAGFLLMFVFAVWEWWNDRNHGTHEGDIDWWDAFLIFCIGLTVILTLHLCGEILIRWY